MAAEPAGGGDARTDHGTARTFRRSLWLRTLGLLTTLLLCAATAARLAAGETGVGFWILLALAVLSLIAAVGAWGDRVRLDADGLEVRNLVWMRLGLAGRRLAWSDVVSVREHRRARPGSGDESVRAIFVMPRAGRRLVLDSLQDFDEARRIIARRCGPNASSSASPATSE